jgi:hypothetical protein
MRLDPAVDEPSSDVLPLLVRAVSGVAPLDVMARPDDGATPPDEDMFRRLAVDVVDAPASGAPRPEQALPTKATGMRTRPSIGRMVSPRDEREPPTLLRRNLGDLSLLDSTSQRCASGTVRARGSGRGSTPEGSGE